MSKKLSTKPNKPINVSLEYHISRFTLHGWQIVTRTEMSVQLKKAKQWSHLLLILGLVGLPAFGGGIFFFLLALFDYLIKKDRLVYFTSEDIRAGKIPNPEIPTDLWFVIIVLFLFLLMLACTGFFGLAFISG